MNLNRTLALLIFAFACIAGNAQPLQSPYSFAIGEEVDIDTSLTAIPFEKAGSRGQVKLLDGGHLGFDDGSRFRIVGTTLQWGAVFPDSAAAVRIARRLRSLGVNCIRLNTFDVHFWNEGSILAPGNTSTAGLSLTQMAKFDWFMHQLRENGIYYVFSFHSVWQPREGDGVRQPDSVGWGTRIPFFFDPVVQSIHRTIVKNLLNHVNSFTGIAYKEDPALAYVIAAEDGTFILYWLYTQDVVRPNELGDVNMGTVHLAHIDSLWHAWLRGKGYTTDAALNNAWAQRPSSTENLLRNGGFEDPFSSAWTLNVNTMEGAQALLQYSESDKQEGTTSGRIRINTLDQTRNAFGVALIQRLTDMERLKKYTLSFWAKTTPQRSSRIIQLLVFNSTVPFNLYGLNTNQNITSQWTKYSYTFTSTVTDRSSATVAFLLGLDSGDVFLDDVQFLESTSPGLFPGESITGGTVKRSMLRDASITPARATSNAQFYFENVRNVYDRFRRMVRDSLKSKVLLCPSTRVWSFFEHYATREYDIFSSTEWRGSEQSIFSDQYGGTLSSLAQNRYKGKAFVLSQNNAVYPNRYQNDMMVYLPSYSGLQDWDGMFFGIFTEQSRAGSAVIDSNSSWLLLDKPNILTLFPWTSSLIRSGSIATTTKEIVIDNTREAIDLPVLHSLQPYSLSIGVDGRMPLFRRISMNLEPQPEESLLPQREISALSDQVDIAALDAENEQMFWNATNGTFRLRTPRHLAVAGNITGQIVSLLPLVVEQTSTAPHTLIAFSSQTDAVIGESPRNLLVVGTRALRQGARFNAANELTVWGSGPTQLEGVNVRLTLTAPLFDTMYVQPLGPDGMPNGTPIIAQRNALGRFTATVSTQAKATPWYRVELLRNTTSVDDAISIAELRVAPNPTLDGSFSVVVPEGSTNYNVRSAIGEMVASGALSAETQTITLDTAPSGIYLVEAYRNKKVTGRVQVAVTR